MAQREHQRGRDRGEVTATVVMVPVILLATLFVVQFGLAYYARSVLAGATQDGAAAGARHDSGTGDATALTDDRIEESAGALLDSHSSRASIDAQAVTVTAEGKVVSLLPFLGSITVRASSSATVEQFHPQGAPCPSQQRQTGVRLGSRQQSLSSR